MWIVCARDTSEDALLVHTNCVFSIENFAMMVRREGRSVGVVGTRNVPIQKFLTGAARGSGYPEYLIGKVRMPIIQNFCSDVK